MSKTGAGEACSGSVDEENKLPICVLGYTFLLSAASTDLGEEVSAEETNTEDDHDE